VADIQEDDAGGPMKKSTSLFHLGKSDTLLGAYGRAALWLGLRGIVVLATVFAWRYANEIYDRVRNKKG
jgi:hypothetical protein